jgi:predicted RNA-binding protein with PIN domain
MATERLVLIDGYNLIHRAPLLKPGPDRTLREAREKLLNLLAWAVGTGDARFIVVFDGAEGGGRDQSSARVDVRYSRPPEKADDLIRRLVEDQVERVERLTVVTSDLEVARHARAMGADVSLSDLFLTSVLGPGQEKADEKPTGMSKAELEQWAELFRNRPRPASEEGESTH